MATWNSLFDVNASVGLLATGPGEFPTVRSRLEAMDRLGVARALVWHAGSVQNHALSGNQMLLEEIRRTPGAPGRLIPALTVSGLLAYERDGLATLRTQMRAGSTRALRFVNAFGRLTLMQLEPVIREVRPLKPFIVLAHNQATIADVMEFSAAFPDVPLVLTSVMWGPCATVFELMRRRRNVLLELSWMHSFGAVEMAVKEFGASRVLFGTGPKSHGGAAIGALARATLTPPQRERIAHGNLDRLCGLKPARALTPIRWRANTLWPRFLAGQPLDVDVVDAHGHVGAAAGYVLEAQDERAQIKRALAEMDALGIRTFFVSGMQALNACPVAGNERVEQVLRPHHDRILGYVAFNPCYAAALIPRLDGYFRGTVFKGFKTHCAYWQVDITDKRYAPMWAYADRYRLPVLSHTWDGPYNTPSMFKHLVKRYPNVAFLMGHAGGGNQGRAEAEALAHAHPNVYLEWCGSFCSTVCWEDTLQRVSPRQVVFGTDAMLHGFAWELARLLSLDVSDAVLALILGGNMRRILARRRPLR